MKMGSEAVEEDPAVKAYESLAVSFIQGLIRIWGAEAASARLVCACMAFHQPGHVPVEGKAAQVFDHLARIEYRSFDAFQYVTNVSHLIYATTLLDTFLTDTTCFLFLLFPHSMGKDQQLPLRVLIDASSRNDALTKAAISRAREISYLSFEARIEFLVQTFGLHLSLTKEDVAVLNHYAGIRNVAVHDQGIYELHLDENGRPFSSRKTCPRHPTRIKGEELEMAIHLYDKVGRSVGDAVFRQVLKQTKSIFTEDSAAAGSSA